MNPPTPQAIDYESYLKVPELLSLQQLLSQHHDETLFILIHQVHELWFKEILHELNEVVRCFNADDIQRSVKVLHRILTVQKVLVAQIDVLETMTPIEFAAFRDHLRPASGFQSVQFREIEFFSGLKNHYFLKAFANQPNALERLEAHLAAPTLYDHFIRLLARRGFEIPQDVLERDVKEPYQSHEKVLHAIETIYQNTQRYFDLYTLCEALLSFDENFSFWRFRHLKMVERTIGMKTGTGGSSGAKYLASTIEGRFFPELWEVRNLIGTY